MSEPGADGETEVDVVDLMEPPDGTVRVGDEFHDPANWQTCPECGVDCPNRSTSCFNCKADLEADDA